MDDNKKSALLKAANKLKNAKKNVSSVQGEGTKNIKNANVAGDAIASRVKDAVSKFGRE